MQKYLTVVRRRWLQVLAAGLALFLATEFAWNVTRNSNFLPTLLILGSFTVPVVFVTYIYEYEYLNDVPLNCLASCFLAGGVIGIIAAGLIENAATLETTYLNLFLVGIIEETSKLIMPGYQYLRRKRLSEADGILFGVASGMGFAALETMGFGMSTLIISGRNVSLVNQLLFIRGLLSPAGHAAWTGLVTAVIWRERARGKHGILNPSVALAFGGAVLLHFLWNLVNDLTPLTTTGVVLSVTGLGIIALASLALLIRRLREAARLHRSTDLNEKNEPGAS